MDFTFQQYEESAQAICARLGGFAPKVAMILGSGLGYLGDQVGGGGDGPLRRDPLFQILHRPGAQGPAGLRHSGGPAGGGDAGPHAPL